MKKLYFCTISNNLTMMSLGLLVGWGSSSLTRLQEPHSQLPLTDFEAAWVTSFLSIGGALGVMPCILIVNIIGRKWTIFLTAIPQIVGWLLLATATSVWQLYLGRLIAGLSVGSSVACVMMYMGEISPPNIRGVLTCMMTVFSKSGILFSWVVGPFLEVRDLSLISMAFPIVSGICTMCVPESPYHLMRRRRRSEAIEALRQLRGTSDVSQEADLIEKSVNLDLDNDTGVRELLCAAGNRKALIAVLGVGFTQQWSGSMAILSYTEMIFNAANTPLEGKYITMFVGCVQVLCALISAIVVERFGRRTLLMTSAFGTSVSTMLVGLYFFLKSAGEDVTEITWLPALGVILYFLTYALGLAALPYTLISELFPTNVKALGSALGILFLNVLSSLVTLIYPIIGQQYDTYTPFWLFSTISFLGTIFVYFCVPETKGRTLQELQEKLQGRKLF